MSKFILRLLPVVLLCACISSPKIDLGEVDTSSETEFQWPVYGAQITQKFRASKKKHRRRHQGIDLAASRNTPIYSIDNGIVSYAGAGFTGYGRLIIVDHVSGYQSYYAHLSRFKANKGDIVKKGELVGLMGNSGRSTGTHLHFEIRKKDYALNPLDYLPTETATAQTAAP